MEPTHSYSATGGDVRTRLDVFLAERCPELTRSAVKNLLEKGLVLVNGSSAKAGYRLHDGDRVDVEVPQADTSELAGEDIPLDILYEDSEIIIINKPSGLVVHPGAGVRCGTLVNALAHHTRELSSVGGPQRPGIVHRLDKDTTGVLAVAKNDASHASLALQFKEHSTTRRYVALVWGIVKDDEGEIDLPLGRDVTHRKKISIRTRKSRHALTRYRVLSRYSFMSLVELTPLTGRTHQLRVHLAAINHPVAGDPLYCRRKPPQAMPKPVVDALKAIKRQLLHAETLGIRHPATGEYMEFSAPMPPDMAAVVDALEEQCS